MIASIITRAKIIQDYMLEKYDRESLEIRMKSKLLLYFLGFMTAFLPVLIFVNLKFNNISFNSPLAVLAIDTVLMIFFLTLLAKGYYNSIVYLLFVLLTFTLITFLVWDFITDHVITEHMLFYIFVIITIQFLFTTRRLITIFLMIILGLSTIIFYYWMETVLSPTEVSALRGFQIDFAVSLVILFSVGLLSMSLNKVIIERLKESNVTLKQEMDRRIKAEKEMVQVYEKTRRSVGRELHDDLGQILVASKMRSEIMMDAMKDSSREDLTCAQKIIELLDSAIEKTRNLSRGLGLIDLHIDNFIQSLHTMVDFVDGIGGIECCLDCSDGLMITEDLIAINLYHIIQEAINNAIKHGKASRIDIKLYQTAGNLLLTVADNGVGIDQSVKGGRGSGLRIMKYRANLINGTIRIQNQITGGTALICSID